jgi:hypothetical protein
MSEHKNMVSCSSNFKFKKNLPSNSRRDFFGRMGEGLYGAAIAYLLGRDLFSVNPTIASVSRLSDDVKPSDRTLPPKAKAVIQLFMTGGPARWISSTRKPALSKYAGQLPRAFLDTVESVGAAGGLMPSPFKFSKYGKSGIEVSEVMPHLTECVDDIALVRSMWTTHFNHEPAVFFMHSGSALPGKTSPRILDRLWSGQ